MTESSTLTVYQVLQKRLGTSDPARCCLVVLDRVEALEKLVREMLSPVETPLVRAENLEVIVVDDKKQAARDRMAKARAARKVKNG